MDETWVNAGHTVNKTWVDTHVKTAKSAHKDGLTTGMKAPSGKGARLILLHAGGSGGFVHNCLCLFKAKSGHGDYHEEMDGGRFQKWFQTCLLQNCPPNSVFILDNASYHSVKVDSFPVKAWTKDRVRAWLTLNDIEWTEDMLKAELFGLVEPLRNNWDKFVIDEMANEAGHMVLRTPPYHCELNPIEMVWAFIKQDVAKHNTSFKLADVEVLMRTAVDKVTPTLWKNCIDHVVKVEREMWQMDSVMDDIPERLIIELGDSSDSTQPDSDDDCCYDTATGDGLMDGVAFLPDSE